MRLVIIIYMIENGDSETGGEAKGKWKIAGTKLMNDGIMFEMNFHR